MAHIYNKLPPIKAYKKLIEYAAFIDDSFCQCRPEINKKESTQPYSTYNSRNLRVSQTINSYPGGRIQFGDTYLNNFRGFYINYLGRREGMPGGSGAPIKNKF